jgi:hypothetical protein
MKRAGKTTVRAARATVTVPSSSGWRSTSRTRPAELEHLVEKEHAVMRETDLTRPRLRTTADQRGVRDRVMRRAEWAIDQQACALGAAVLRPNART